MRDAERCASAWTTGRQRVTAVWEAASAAQREAAGAVAADMMDIKVSLQQIAQAVDAAAHCATCGGACCRAGRYHFRRVDLIPYLLAQTALFTPAFGNGLCPFLVDHRCLMAPQHRPFNCITFNCEVIEDCLAPQERERFYDLERELRECYRRIEALFPAGEFSGALLDLDAVA